MKSRKIQYRTDAGATGEITLPCFPDGEPTFTGRRGEFSKVAKTELKSGTYDVWMTDKSSFLASYQFLLPSPSGLHTVTKTGGKHWEQVPIVGYLAPDGRTACTCCYRARLTPYERQCGAQIEEGKMTDEDRFCDFCGEAF